MWPSSARFLLFPVLLSFAVLSLGTPVPQQAPEFLVHAASLEPEDDPARLRRYQTYGLKQATVERVQPASNVHPDAAPFMNVPDVRETNANLIGQSPLGGYDGAIQQQGVSVASPQVPAQAPMIASAVAPEAVPGAVLGAVPGAGLRAVPDERYSSPGDVMGASTLSDNVASHTMGAQGTSHSRDMRGSELEMSGSTIPTSDVSLHMSSGPGAYASQGRTNMSPGAEQAVPVGANSAIPEGAVTSRGVNPGFALPIQTTSHDSTNAPEANVGAPTAGAVAAPIENIVGAPTANIVGTSTVRQGILEQSQGRADLANFYTSRMVEPTAAQNGQFNGQEGPHSQYGEMVDASGMQTHSPGLGVSGGIPENIGNEAYTVRTISDGPTVAGRLMVA